MRHCHPALRAVERVYGPGVFTGNGHRPVARQPVRPVLVSGLQRLLDEQPAKPGTVDKQIRLNLRPVVQVQGADEAILAAQLHLHHLALDAHHPPRQRVPAQVLRVQTRIKVQRVGQAG
jgi:hypothetical protein